MQGIATSYTNLKTPDQPATRYMGADVIAQLDVNSKPVLTCIDHSQASEDCASASLFCGRYRGLLEPVRIKGIHPVLVSHSLAPCIVPDWTVVKVGHPRISSSLLIHQWLTDSRPRANILVITVIIILNA